MITCSTCNQSKPPEAFYFRQSGPQKGKPHPYCRPCYKERYQSTHVQLKAEVMAAYGGSCACCGESELMFLTVDHKDGGGAAHRRTQVPGDRRRFTGRTFYRWLKEQGWPEGFQVLCFNCNFAKQWGGCPHQQ